MKKNRLIALLNKDMADEHSAVIRYLVHGWMEGEDTPIGAGLLSRSREEMWHMHWLGLIICQLGGEPDFAPAHYHYDPYNRASIFKSYAEYEEALIPHYNGEAEMVDDPHIRRVLLREAWESAVHAGKFRRVLDTLTPEEAEGLPEVNPELPVKFLSLLQKEVTGKYNEMLQHIRYSWLFQKNGGIGWGLMDQAMEKMKHIAHFAEEIAENGMPPEFIPGKTDKNVTPGKSLKKAVLDVSSARDHHLKLKNNSELKKHKGLLINLDLTIKQETYQAEELNDMMKKK